MQTAGSILGDRDSQCLGERPPNLCCILESFLTSLNVYGRECNLF